MQCMSEGRSIYRLDDTKRTPGCFPVANFTEADQWNEKKWGIFFTVNSFSGPRKKENLKKIMAWALDFDSGSKEEQRERILEFKLCPTQVIETQRGFHVYFDSEQATEKNHEKIMAAMVEVFDADQGAKDICRILRVPGYCHWKNQDDPFGVKSIFVRDVKYTEREMVTFLKKNIEKKNPEVRRKEFKSSGIYDYDCRTALEKLSGTQAVNGDLFSFRSQRNGKTSILVNGKNANCWLDTQGKIGSCDKGGPSIVQWVDWYQKDMHKTMQLLKQHLPEGFK